MLGAQRAQHVTWWPHAPGGAVRGGCGPAGGGLRGEGGLHGEAAAHGVGLRGEAAARPVGVGVGARRSDRRGGPLAAAFPAVGLRRPAGGV